MIKRRTFISLLGGAVGQAISAARCRSGIPSDLYGARRIY